MACGGRREGTPPQVECRPGDTRWRAPASRVPTGDTRWRHSCRVVLVRGIAETLLEGKHVLAHLDALAGQLLFDGIEQDRAFRHVGFLLVVRNRGVYRGDGFY